MSKSMTASEMGKKGGKNRARNLTKKQLSDSGKYAANCRWSKQRRNGKAK